MDDPALRSGNANEFRGSNASKSKSSRAFGNTTSGENVTTPTSINAATTLSNDSPVTDKIDSCGNYVISNIEHNYVILNDNLDEDITKLIDIQQEQTRGLKTNTVNKSAGEETNLKKSGE